MHAPFRNIRGNTGSQRTWARALQMEVYQGVSAPKRHKVEDKLIGEVPKKLLITDADDEVTRDRKRKQIKAFKNRVRMQQKDTETAEKATGWQSFITGKGSKKKKVSVCPLRASSQCTGLSSPPAPLLRLGAGSCGTQLHSTSLPPRPLYSGGEKEPYSGRTREVATCHAKPIEWCEVSPVGFWRRGVSAGLHPGVFVRVEGTPPLTRFHGAGDAQAPKGVSKESMFKSPDAVDGKVGVTGSGKGTTEFVNRARPDRA